MRFLKTSLVALAGLASLPSFGQAQMVIVAPGYVRAPFVRVYRDPFGGKHVQAPFVDVYRPGRGVPPTVIRHPDAPGASVQYRWHPQGGAASGQPTVARPANLTPQQQLQYAAAEFDRDLSRFDTAATWQTYFALDAGGALSQERLSRKTNGPTPDMAAMLSRFDSVETEAQYSMIAALPSFSQTRDALTNYLSDVPARDIAPNAEELPAPQPELKQESAGDPLLR